MTKPINTTDHWSDKLRRRLGISHRNLWVTLIIAIFVLAWVAALAAFALYGGVINNLHIAPIGPAILIAAGFGCIPRQGKHRAHLED